MNEKTRQARYIADRRERGDVTTISVLIPSDMKAQMDDAADAAGMTRKDWIAAAIAEKLDRERRSGGRKKKAAALSLAFLLTGAGVGAMASKDHRAMPPWSPAASVVADVSGRPFDQTPRIIPASDTICRPLTVITTSSQNSPSVDTAGTRTGGNTEILRRTWSVGCGRDRIISETKISLPE